MSHIDDKDTHRANHAYIKGSMRVPLLDAERERELAQSWRARGDEGALHKLVSAYARLVVPFAMKYRRYGLPIGDLIQEGNLGLMEAAARFDPERGVRFSTYATWWIRSRMQDFVLRNWSIVRTGTTAAQKSLFFNLRRLQARISTHAEERLTADGQRQIARLLDVRVSEVAEMETRLSRSDQSLNITLAEGDGREWQDLLPDDRPDPEDAAIESHDARARTKCLALALDTLSPRERMVIRQRRLDGDGMTLEELGMKLGISKERVRQIESRAFEKMRTALLRSIDGAADLLPS